MSMSAGTGETTSNFLTELEELIVLYSQIQFEAETTI